MADPIEKTVASLGEDGSGDPIDEAAAEHGPIDPTVAIETAQKELQEESVEDFITREFSPPEGIEPSPEQASTTDTQYMQDVAFVAGKDEVDPDPEGDLAKAEQAKERLREVEMVNEELKSVGSIRRYVVNENDAPESAHVYEDDFGKYYYKGFDEKIRPSDVAEFAGQEAWVLLSDDEQVVKTIELLNQFSGEPLADAASKEAAQAWLERHLTLPADETGDDVFDPEVVEMTAKTLAVAEAQGE